MKKMICAIAALTAITAISACSAQALDAAAETAAPAETSAAASAVTALETTEDSKAETSEEAVLCSEEVEVYAPGSLTAVGIAEDDPVCFGCAPEETSELKNRVFIVSVEPDTPDETINELFEKCELDILYDYDNFNMYAVSAREPLNEEDSDAVIRTLEEYDFILMVEPDSVVYLDNAEVQ